jgi:hypothetical protein
MITHDFRGIGTPPWMDPDQPWFDECAAADREQDLELAAKAAAEQPPLQLVSAPLPHRIDWAAIRDYATAVGLSDAPPLDELTARRRRNTPGPLIHYRRGDNNRACSPDHRDLAG